MGFREPLQEVLPVSVIEENGASSHATRGDVIVGAGILNSQWSSQDVLSPIMFERNEPPRHPRPRPHESIDIA